MVTLSDLDFWLPTPKGVYQFIQHPADTPYSRLIAYLFSTNKSITLHSEGLAERLGTDEAEMSALFDHIVSNDWVCRQSDRVNLPKTDIDTLLSTLVKGGKVMLTDTQGFTLANTGFDETNLDLLSAMSTEIIEVYQKYQALINDDDLKSPAWGMIDHKGYCELGIWRLTVAENVFLLMVEGRPEFDSVNFVTLIWMLHYRYHQRTRQLN